MWRRLKNIFYSFETYADLTPDLRMRQRVNRSLRDRAALSADAWFEQLWQPRTISKQVANFVYLQMPLYSGLDFARVRPTDRLNDDLQLPLVCWFDWQVSFCDDFLIHFGIDLSDYFDPQDYSTVEALIIFLNHQLLSLNHS